MTFWNRRTTKLVVTLIAALVVTFLLPDGDPSPSTPVPTTPPAFTTSTITTNAFIIRAVDGDTIEVRLDGTQDAITVRLLGVNTPETVDPRRPVECFGKEASAFTKAQTEGRRARLEDDPEADEVDKYGRLLRNVIVDSGLDLNAALVREGYAYAYVSFPLTLERKAELMRLETEARAAKRGLWDPNTCPVPR